MVCTQASADAGDRQADEFDDAIQMTLRWHRVGISGGVLAGAEEGLFPHKMSMETRMGSRKSRLAYVGLPVLKRLYISYAESRGCAAQGYNARSHFIKEIPDEVMQEIRMTAKISRPVRLSGSRIAPVQPLENHRRGGGYRVDLASVSSTCVWRRVVMKFEAPVLG